MLTSRELPIREVKDVDGDGRPVLLLALPLGDNWGPCEEEVEHDTTVYTPLFLGHSLADGTLSTRDDAAQKHILKSCPALPKRPMTYAFTGSA